MSKMIDTGRCSFGLLGLLAAVVLVSPAKTADIVKSTGADQQTTITFTGTIVEGDALKFSRLLTRKHPVTVVKLNSRGGNIAEATKIAAMVRNANITTAVARGAMCNSACFLVFAAGKQKFAELGAAIGVHSARDNMTGKENDRSAAATVTMARLLKSYGVPEHIVGKLVTTKTETMTWLWPDDLRSMGVQMAAPWPRSVTTQAIRPEPPPQGAPPTHVKTPSISSPDCSSTLPHRVVLYEDDPADAQGHRFAGTVIWCTQIVSPRSGQLAEPTIQADVEIPERHIAMTMSIRRNADQALPASHTVMIEFTLPADFPFGGVSNVSGILMKQAEEASSSRLAGLIVKVTSGSFLVRLSPVEPLMQHNIELLKDRDWFNIPIVYNNGRRAILALEKGAAGEQVFAKAFAAWRDKPEAPPGPPAGLPSTTQAPTDLPAQGAIPRVVLYEENPLDASGRKYIGSTIWRTEMVSPGAGQPAEIAIRADLEIPERRITMTVSIRRNTDKALPASHTVEIMFNLPADFPFGGVSNVPGILMKQAEQTPGAPLNGLAVKVTSGFFLVGLSLVKTEMQRNMELLKERGWFDIPIVYNNGKPAILTIEKGAAGEQVFADAFEAWRDPASPNPETSHRERSVEPTAPRAPMPGGYVVQLFSGRSESEAWDQFRSLQAKYQGVLGDREPIIRRADLGDQGVYYRAQVGPFPTVDQANEICGNLKSAGGQCIVQRN
jgi:hypothetical protein